MSHPRPFAAIPMSLLMAPDEPRTRRGTRLPPEVVARYAGLNYVSDAEPGISRKRWGSGWTYRTPSGETIRDRKVRDRIEALVIPPAWTDVWICADPLGHLQATGRDEAGRKQYRYHPGFREARNLTKFSRLVMFGMSLTRMRERVEKDLHLEGLPRARVLAAAVRILDTNPIRVGNAQYARRNQSYGLTTMRERHVEFDGDHVRFRFTGKSGKEHRVGVFDRKVVGVLQECCEVPGWELFKYFDETGRKQYVTSDDVNAYIRRVSGYDFTAKDFRTWAGTVRTVTVLGELGPGSTVRERKSRAAQAVKFVAADLGNTPATCRSYYIHPYVLEAYEEARLLPHLERIRSEPRPKSAEGLTEEEWPVMALLPRLEAEAEGEDLEALLRRSLDEPEGADEEPEELDDDPGADGEPGSAALAG